MRATLTKAMLLAATAVATSVVAAPAASATGGDTMVGGCGFDTDENATVTGGAQSGVLHDLSATLDPAGLPTDATVSCRIEVNGAPAPGTTYSYSGFGVQGGADRVSYDDGGGTYPTELCQRVVYADGTDTGWQCPPEPSFVLCDIERGCPSPWVVDLVNGVFLEDIDPRVCPALAALAGTYGPVTIDPDGDVSVPDPLVLFDGPVYDCPPYRNP